MVNPKKTDGPDASGEGEAPAEQRRFRPRYRLAGRLALPSGTALVLGLGSCLLTLACAVRQPDKSTPSRPPGEGAGPPEAEGSTAPADRERRWIVKRVPADPLVCYLLGEGHEDMLPLYGSLLRNERFSQDRVLGRHAGWQDTLALAREVKRITALGLTPEDAVHSTQSGVRIGDGGKLYSLAAGRRLAVRIKRSGVFSVEAVLAPADTKHAGPARIVSLSRDGGVRNFTLGQEHDQWVVRLRTSENDDNGCSPELPMKGLSTSRTHVAVTYDGRAVRLYLNGELRETRKEVRGDLDRWDPSYPLVLGNEYAERRDWAGVIRFVAFYDRVLSAEEVRAAAKDLPPGDPPLGAQPAPPGSVPQQGVEVF